MWSVALCRVVRVWCVCVVVVIIKCQGSFFPGGGENSYAKNTHSMALYMLEAITRQARCANKEHALVHLFFRFFSPSILKEG